MWLELATGAGSLRGVSDESRIRGQRSISRGQVWTAALDAAVHGGTARQAIGSLWILIGLIFASSAGVLLGSRFSADANQRRRRSVMMPAKSRHAPVAGPVTVLGETVVVSPTTNAAAATARIRMPSGARYRSTKMRANGRK